MKTQRTLTIDLDELKGFLRDKFNITAPLYNIKIEMIENAETRDKAICLTWSEDTNTDSDSWRR